MCGHGYYKRAVSWSSLSLAVPDALLVIFHQEKVASWKISPIFKEGHNSMDSDDIFQTLQHDVDIEAIQFFVVFLIC